MSGFLPGASGITITGPITGGVKGGILVESAANVLAEIAAVAVGSVLASNGVNVPPVYTTSPSLTQLTLSADLVFQNLSTGTAHNIDFTGVPAAGVEGDWMECTGAIGGPATAIAVGGRGGQWEVIGGTGGTGSALQVGGPGGAARLLGGEGGASGGAGRGQGGGVRMDAGSPAGGAHVAIGNLNASDIAIGRASIATVVQGRLSAQGDSWDFTGTLAGATCGGNSPGPLGWVAAGNLTETITGSALRTAAAHGFFCGGTNPLYLLPNQVYIQPGAQLIFQNTSSAAALAGNSSFDFSLATGVFKTSTGLMTVGGLMALKVIGAAPGASAAGTNVLYFRNVGGTDRLCYVDAAGVEHVVTAVP